jgi:hypothetical protein
MYQQAVFTRSSETRGLLIHFQDDEAMMARRFHDLAVVERRSTHHCVVELSNGLRDPDVIKVEDGSNVTFFINRVKVQGVAFVEGDVEPGWVKCINRRPSSRPSGQQQRRSEQGRWRFQWQKRPWQKASVTLVINYN